MFQFWRKKQKDMKKSNDKDKSIISREDVLSGIAAANGWSDVKDKSQYEIIEENLKWLKKNLNLRELEYEIMLAEREGNVNGELSGWLTSRQAYCMLGVCRNLSLANNIEGAYHELYDFIESYGQLVDKPIDVVERIIIRNSIMLIEVMIQKNS